MKFYNSFPNIYYSRTLAAAINLSVRETRGGVSPRFLFIFGRDY